VTCSKFPAAQRREFFWRRQGFFSPGQGKFFGAAGTLENSPLIGFTESIY
jgi:hypothetical protein